MIRSLAGQWLYKATDEADFAQAEVPGCQFLDLLRNGVIADPFVGTVEQDVQWVHDKDYLYCKEFVVSAQELCAEDVQLVCRRLDTVCTLTLNGHEIGKADNCHRTYRFAVKQWLRQGTNRLEILFYSPKKYVEAKYRAYGAPPNSNGQNGIVHIRKPQCHFGWDWGPVLIPVGIGGDIYLDLAFGPRLGEPEVKTIRTATGYTIHAHATGADRIRLTDPDGAVFEQTGETAVFAIDDPRLWWTRELSGKQEQPLYTVCTLQMRNGEEDRKSKKVGLRTIVLDRQKDRYGYNFRFVLNDVPLFVKGANYIPPDSFVTRFDADKRKALLDAVQFGNLNMIRVWGGGYYADDELLDECDRRGILVWQDCMFACQAYPFFDGEFCDNVLREIDDNVRRISSHPCLALWCGNNEIEAMHLAWATMKRYVEWTERFFYHILPERIAQNDSQTPYIAGSPIGTAHNKNIDADHSGDTHLWGVWHGLQPIPFYRRRFTRFCSEFGFESLPSLPTMRMYAAETEDSLGGKVQRSHQKCVGGNDKMLYYIASRFRLSNSIEDLIYLSQVIQMTCIADATEHWRRNRGRCNGAMYWQLNDCWPTCSWSGYDYGGRYKALQYGARRFNAPVTVSLCDTRNRVEIYLLNDLTTRQTLTLEWEVFDFAHTSPTKSRKTLTIEPLQTLLVDTVDTSRCDARHSGVAVRLYQDGQCLVQKTAMLLPEKKLRLPRAPIAVQEEIVDGRRKITVSSPVFQRLVMLQNDSAVPFSDNFFDLLPGETKVVWQEDARDLAPVAVKSVASLQQAGRIRSLWAGCKVFLSARNLASAIYYHRLPKPYSEDN